MSLHLEPETGIPYYVQLRDQMRDLIRTGVWQPGYRLPPERELARDLGISRNTVGTAYKELAQQGLLESRQGRGTFVCATPARPPSHHILDSTEALQGLLDAVLDQALALGCDLDSFVRAAAEVVERRRVHMAEIKIVFVECNREQLNFLTRELRQGAGVHVRPRLLSAIRHDSATFRREIKEADLVLTTFFHLAEVEQLVGGECEVLGIALDPEIETIVRIARLPRGIPLGLVCLSRNFAERVLKSMEIAGLTDFKIEVETSADDQSIEQLARKIKAFIVSPGRRSQVEALVDRRTPVIEFIYHPDAGSVNLLKSRLLEKRQNGKG